MHEREFESTPSPRSESTPLPIGVIETDAFCDRCGFNLHSQKVWRDGRLGILITRCPECGAHQTAGVRTAVTSPWLNRLALLGLMVWTALALAFIGGTFFMHFGIQVSSAESLLDTRFETRAGEPVRIDYADGVQQWKRQLPRDDGTFDEQVIPVADVVRRTMLVQAIGGPSNPSGAYYYNNQIPLTAVVVLGAIYLASTFANACLAAAGSWFWRPAWRAFWLAVPLVAALLAIVMERSTRHVSGPAYQGVEFVGRNLYYQMIGAVLVAQLAVIGIGLLIGRSIARFLLSVIVPPGARQLFAFLWHCDGKTMPAKTLPAPRGS